MKKFILLILTVLTAHAMLPADSLSFSLSQNMTDNLFQNRFAEKDQLSDLSLYLDKSFSQFTLFAEGKYSYIYENSDLASFIQDV